MALVFVLAMLVLILIMVTAFFSRTILHRQTSSVSASGVKGQALAQAASAFILDDIEHEIEAGSVEDPMPNATVAIRQPITLTESGIPVPVAPSMAPQRVGDQELKNIVKVSRSGLPFFVSGTGYRALSTRPTSGAARASAISTSAPTRAGRFFSKDRWMLPQLMTATEETTFSVPDWIYLDREGKNPTDFSTTALTDLSSTDSANGDYVIGRYAYVIYDVGGLIDINVAGNALSDDENARRGRLHQVSLEDGIGDVALPDYVALPNFQEFVTWRSATSAGNASSVPGAGGLFDPQRTFLQVPGGEQAFVNRQDLIAYAARAGSPLKPEALPYLTTFSRDIDAPSYQPNPSRETSVPATPVATEMNPALLAIRFSSDTTLARPEGDVPVKAGTPVMPRRFPLSKLSLFAEADPDPEAMLYYFGLTKFTLGMEPNTLNPYVEDPTWRYTATVPNVAPDPPGGHIAKLSEVAALGREPNFFEILQAVIYTGSLGKIAPDTYTFEAEEDALQNLQVMQIGANIIDQADANDRPTAIEYPTGNSGEFFTVYGVENLPYISQIGVVGWRPSDNRDLFQAWAVFDVWNPHQNAATPPVGVDGFRILPISGRGDVRLGYRLGLYGAGTASTFAGTLATSTPAGGGSVFKDNQPLLALNTGREFTFSAAANYSEPTTLGGTPTSSADTPGLLLAECSPGIAIPPQGSRLEAVQQTINGLMDGIAPYTAKLPEDADGNILKDADGNELEMKINSLGQRVYPTGTTITGLNPTYWLAEGPDGLTISGKYGTKAYNYCRPKSDSYREDWRFALQAHYTGDPATTWHTYQVFEGFGNPPGQMDISQSPVYGEGQAAMMVNTDHSAAGAPLQNEFYVWRSRSASTGMVKTDPRTNRLGFSGWSQASGSTARNDFLGNSARHSADPLPANFFTDYGGGFINNDYRWAVPSGGGMSGMIGNYQLAPGFELMSTLKDAPPQRNRAKIPLFGLVSNSPDALDATRPFRYSDPDGVVRPGDGYFGTLPTVPGHIAGRPLILNRPFRSVGELGYVFRDLPWKTIDFFSRNSGDLGLLDVFSVSETSDPTPLVAGRINLNTRQPAVLAAALRDSAEQLDVQNAAAPERELLPAEANALAEEIVQESTVRPFSDKSDLITRVLHRSADPLAGKTIKTAREAAVRTLGEIGTVRTWNFLIDVVVQSGRFTSSSKSGAEFMVNAERREWIHVAIDRMTGEILEQRKEVANE